VAATEWWLGGDACRVEQARVHSATVVAKLAGFETREQALALKGRKIAVARTALPDKDDGRYYLADLVGLEVVNEQGLKLGVVRQWFTNGPQDVMELAGDRVRLVPWVPTVVAKLAGIETREQALALKGSRIAVARAVLPDADDGRYYLADLVGLEVVNEMGLTLGVVRLWLTNGPQDVMELAGERVRLVPWVPAVVKKVDLEAKRIEVEWGADW